MVKHRSTLRLRVVRPVLHCQNKLQPNTSQEYRPTDFEGCQFDRWYRQGSGLLLQTGTPQNRWAVSFAPERLNRLVVSSSGVLAVLRGCGAVRLSCPGHLCHGGHYFQNLNQGCFCSAGAGASAVCISNVCRRSICSSLVAICAKSTSTRPEVPCACPRSSAGASASPMLTLHCPFCFSESSFPALIRLRTVSAETPRCVAASVIDKSMASTVGVALGDAHCSANADYGQFGGGPGRPVAL